ncbi:MAG: hypothetical protein Q4A83_07975 [Bacillota bacterium]|nr:hypothetical protein [Bacillota bacterium]
MKRLISILLVFAMVLCLAACGSHDGSESEEEVKVMTPEEVVAAGLDCIISFDEDSVAEYFIFEDDDTDLGNILNSGNDAEEAEDSESAEDIEIEEDTTELADAEMVKLIFSHMTYKIIGSEINGDTATVTVDITNKDAAAAFGSAFLALLSIAFSGASDEEIDAAFNSAFTESFESSENDSVTNNVVINLKMIDGKWMADTNNDAFLNAISGGLLSAIEELSDM